MLVTWTQHFLAAALIYKCIFINIYVICIITTGIEGIVEQILERQIQIGTQTSLHSLHWSGLSNLNKLVIKKELMNGKDQKYFTNMLIVLNICEMNMLHVIDQNRLLDIINKMWWGKSHPWRLKCEKSVYILTSIVCSGILNAVCLNIVLFQLF